MLNDPPLDARAGAPGGAHAHVHPDAVVIGAGIIGLACARELAHAGLRVTVFDMAARQGASWVAAGMLSPWGEWPLDRESTGMREEALALYPGWIAGLREENGLPVDIEWCGALAVPFASAPASSMVEELASTRAEPRALTGEEARELEPLLSSEIRDAVLLPGEGYAEPRDLMRSLLAACAIRGVAVREEPVLRLLERGGRVTGVGTPSGEVEAPWTLDAAGAWAAPFLPEDAPVRPVRGQLLALRPVPGTPRLRRVIQSPGAYLVPRRSGSVVVGATSEEVGFEPGVTAAGTRALLEGAERLAPGLARWILEETWSGFRPFREDGPLIGPDRERPGLLNAVGMYRHGILLAPYAARRIRECMEA
jgi:glycine oxidase